MKRLETEENVRLVELGCHQLMMLSLSLSDRLRSTKALSLVA